MNKYELTVVLDAKATPAKKKKIVEMIEKVVSVAQGKSGKPEDWGIIGTGLYLHFLLELEPGMVKAISTKLDQETEILKYLLVRQA